MIFCACTGLNVLLLYQQGHCVVATPRTVCWCYSIKNTVLMSPMTLPLQYQGHCVKNYTILMSQHQRQGADVTTKRSQCWCYSSVEPVLLLQCQQHCMMLHQEGYCVEIKRHAWCWYYNAKAPRTWWWCYSTKDIVMFEHQLFWTFSTKDRVIIQLRIFTAPRTLCLCYGTVNLVPMLQHPGLGLFVWVQNFEFHYFFECWGFVNYFYGLPIWVGIFWGMSFSTGIFLWGGVQFKNVYFYGVSFI